MHFLRPARKFRWNSLVHKKARLPTMRTRAMRKFVASDRLGARMCQGTFLFTEEKGFEPLRRCYRPTGVRSQTLQPLGYSSCYCSPVNYTILFLLWVVGKSFLFDFFYIVNVIKRAQCFNDVTVFFIFFSS